MAVKAFYDKLFNLLEQKVFNYNHEEVKCLGDAEVQDVYENFS